MNLWLIGTIEQLQQFSILMFLIFEICVKYFGEFDIGESAAFLISVR